MGVTPSSWPGGPSRSTTRQHQAPFAAQQPGHFEARRRRHRRRHLQAGGRRGGFERGAARGQRRQQGPARRVGRAPAPLPARRPGPAPGAGRARPPGRRGRAPGVAPSRMRRLHPREVSRPTSPGTANTWRPCSRAAAAVIRAPPVSAASTTTTAAASPAMMRLRGGKRHGSGRVPGGYSVTTRAAGGEQALGQGPVLGRVDDVGAAAQHRHPHPAGIDHPAVGLGVGPARQAAHHGPSGARRTPARRPGPGPSRSGCSGASRRWPPRRPAGSRPFTKSTSGRPGQIAQVGRVARAAAEDGRSP